MLQSDIALQLARMKCVTRLMQPTINSGPLFYRQLLHESAKH